MQIVLYLPYFIDIIREIKGAKNHVLLSNDQQVILMPLKFFLKK